MDRKRDLKVVILTTIFPGAEKLCDCYLESINKQKSKYDFEIVLYCDGADENWTKSFQEKIKYPSRVIESEGPLSIIENRIYQIRYAIEAGYDIIIFADIDDGFSDNRIEGSVDKLTQTKCDFVYNNIEVKNEMYFNDVLANKIDSVLDVKAFNMLGLSNTAIRTKSLGFMLENMNIPKDLVAFDWWLYTSVLNRGGCGYYVPEATTFYGIHENNIAGDKRLTDQKLSLGIRVKEAHYSSLKNIFEDAWKSICKFAKLMENNELRVEYIRLANTMNCSYWWENIDNQAVIEALKKGHKYEV